MKERIVIAFFAIVLGLAITTIAYFIYQQAKAIPGQSNKPKTNNVTSTPTPLPNSNYITIEEPTPESITDKRTVEIKGRAPSNSTIIVTTNQEDKVVLPTSQGTFSVSVTIDLGVNNIIVRAIAPDGEEKSASRVVTFTTEEF